MELRPRLIHCPGQLGQIYLHFSELSRHMVRRGAEDPHQLPVLDPEELHRPPQSGGGGRLQFSGPFV